MIEKASVSRPLQHNWIARATDVEVGCTEKGSTKLVAYLWDSSGAIVRTEGLNSKEFEYGCGTSL